MEGWIKLHRKLAMNKMWLHDEFTRGQAWVDLLMLANHEDGFIRVRGHRIEIKRGQVGWSQESLAKRWKWSRKKVSNFLQELQEMEQQIEQQKNNFSSIITIVNYDLYQQKEQQNEQQKHSKSTAKAQQKHTNKNDKNEKNNKNLFIVPSVEEIQTYCHERKNKIDAQYYFDYQTARKWILKGGQKIKDWKAVIRTWEKNDYNNGGDNGQSTGYQKTVSKYRGNYRSEPRGLDPKTEAEADRIAAEYYARKAATGNTEPVP